MIVSKPGPERWISGKRLGKGRQVDQSVGIEEEHSHNGGQDIKGPALGIIAGYKNDH